jgi:hypothetical protein
MRALTILVLTVTISQSLISQKPLICEKYKIQYNYEPRVDSLVTFLGTTYLNDVMQPIKEVLSEIDKGDSCWKEWKYDQFGNLMQVFVACDKRRNNIWLNRKYQYDQKWELTKETSMQKKPYSEYFTIEHTRDSVIKKIYANKRNLIRNRFDHKTADFFNAAGKPVFIYGIDRNRDTTMSHSYIYFQLSDTSKVRASPGQYFFQAAKSKKVDVIYSCDSAQIQICDYYDSANYEGSTITHFNSRKDIILERYYSRAKSKIIFEVNYVYDSAGTLLQRKNENFSEQVTIVHSYSKGKLTREDYIFGAILDHSILYTYK